MNASTVADVLLIVAAVVWVLARQVQVARVKPRLLVLAPLVLAFFGIRSLPASTRRMPADLALLAAIAARSAQSGFGRLTWRRRTAISCRSTKISTSLEVLLRASSASQPNNRIMS